MTVSRYSDAFWKLDHSLTGQGCCNFLAPPPLELSYTGSVWNRDKSGFQATGLHPDYRHPKLSEMQTKLNSLKIVNVQLFIKTGTSVWILHISGLPVFGLSLYFTRLCHWKSCDGSMVERLVLNPEALYSNPSCSCPKRSTFNCCHIDATHFAINNHCYVVLIGIKYRQ